jgi:pyruvate/2-oxoglutarate dehydrogenase complex dihydrolipoamide dehydrogenase (E3) component
MQTTHFDSIIIGAGQAGPALASRLTAAGQKVALIERKHLGGTCVNNGCMPTKTMVASAYAAHMARRAADFGVNITGNISIDMTAVKARKEKVVLTARGNIGVWLQNMKGLTLVRGHASFVDAHTVVVKGVGLANDAGSTDEQRLSADRFFINVGARASVPPLEGLVDVPFLTNSNIMDVESVPEHLLVLGGSYIGLEFAQVFRRLGAKVTVLEASPRLISREDEDVSTEVRNILGDEGIAFHLGIKNISAKIAAGGGVSVAFTGADGSLAQATGSQLLLALGRLPNTHDLNLEAAGVMVDGRGIVQVDDKLQTSQPHIWALGECNGKGAFTHTAYNDFEIVADNLLKGTSRSVNDRLVTYGLFIDPPLGRVGMTATEAKAQGRNILVGKRPMTRVGRAVEKGETKGFMKIVLDADSKEILGAAILGLSGDEAVHFVTSAMYAKSPYTVLQQTVAAHPTVAELIPTIVGEAKAV